MLIRYYLKEGVKKAVLARHLGVSRRTTYNWIGAGTLDRELHDQPVRSGPRRPVASWIPTAGSDEQLREYAELTTVRLFDEVEA